MDGSRPSMGGSDHARVVFAGTGSWGGRVYFVRCSKGCRGAWLSSKMKFACVYVKGWDLRPEVLAADVRVPVLGNWQ